METEILSVYNETSVNVPLLMAILHAKRNTPSLKYSLCWIVQNIAMKKVSKNLM